VVPTLTNDTPGPTADLEALAWLDTARRTFTQRRGAASDPELVVQLAVGAAARSVHTLGFAGGELTSWTAEESVPCDFALSLTPADAVALIRRDESRPGALARTKLLEPLDGSVRALPLPPLDLDATQAADALPVIPNLSFSVEWRLADTLFGRWRFSLVIVDGRIVTPTPPAVDVPDVVVLLPYWAYLRLRSGMWDVLEALDAGGGLEGDIPALAAAGGLVETDEFREFFATGGAVHLDALAAFAVVLASQPWRRLVEELGT